MKNKINLKKHQNGITLIALVVTIIVLLILAGISISMLTGQNGILNRASEAKGKTGISQEEEIVKISVSDALTQGLGVISTDNLKTALTNNGLKGNLQGDGPWTYTGEYKEYNIERNGSVTSPNQDESSSNKIVKMVGSYGITESGKLVKINLLHNEAVWDEVTIKEEVSEVGKVKNSYNYNIGSCYIINNEGDVYAWGVNDDGQLGIGNTDYQRDPIKINELSNIVKIEENGENYYAITENGEVYVWGVNDDGLLGISSTNLQEVPIKLSGVNNIEKIYFGCECVYAKTKDGNVYAWGNNANGSLGIGNGSDEWIDEPVKINGLTNVDDIYLSKIDRGVYFKTKEGDVYCCGGAPGIQLKENEEDYYIPSKIENLRDVDKIFVSGDDTYVLGKDKIVYHIYIDNENMKSVIEKMDNLINIEKIYSFYDDIGSLYAQNNNGEIYAWGNNSDGSLGIGNDSEEWIAEPVKVNGLANVEKIYNLGNSIYAKNKNGEIYAWGNNSDGVLGIGNDSDSCIYEPVKINGLTNVEELYFPNDYVEKKIRIVYAKTSTGMVYSWGANSRWFPALCLGGGISNTSIPICWNNVQGLLKDNNVKIESLQCEETYIYGLKIYILTEDDKIYSYSASTPM